MPNSSNPQNATVVDSIRADGEPVHFINNNGAWYVAYWIQGQGWSSASAPRLDMDIRLSTNGTNWYITDASDTVETYDNTGELVTVTYRNGYSQTLTYSPCGTDNYGNAMYCNTAVSDNEGRQITFQYQQNTGLVSSFTDAANNVTQYSYVDRSGAPALGPGLWSLWALQTVTYPTTPVTSTTYGYTDPNPINRFALTSITDENQNIYASFTYDSTTGRAISSQHAGGVDLTSIQYNDTASPPTRTVTNALGKQFIYTMNQNQFQGQYQIASIEGLASAHTPDSLVQFGYDANGFLNLRTSGEGRKTFYQNDSLGRVTEEIDGYQSSVSRTINTTWDPNYDVPDIITKPNLTISMTYPNGLLSTLTETDTTTQTVPYSTNGETRTWNFTYFPSGNSCSPIAGLLWTVQGPPIAGTTPITTYCYNANGFVSSITNPLGKVTQITQWNVWGQPLTSTDPNGITTSYTYDVRTRLKTITVNPGSNPSLTQFGYDNAGNLTNITFPDNSSLTYGYDSAHRLETITNNLNEEIGYALDPVGDRTNATTSKILHLGHQITRIQSATFDELGRILTELGSNSQLTQHGYDKDNNEISRIDPRSKLYQHGFDAIERLMSEIGPDQTAQTATTIGYNGKDEVTGVTDARANQTSYVRDGFGDIIQITSPDTGTAVLWYDANGKVIKKIDSQNIETDYTNDVIGRVTSRSIKGTTAENVTYTWDVLDNHSYGIGRLGKITDPSGTTTLWYDAFGNLKQDKRVIGATTYTTSYTYDAADHVKKTTYPSGLVVTLGRDGFGRVQSVTAQLPGQSSVTIASGATYEPFGPLNGLLFGNGLSLTEAWDEDYHLSSIFTANGSNIVQNLSYSDDPDGNIQTITDNLTSTRSQSFGYDDLNRIASASGIYGSQSYLYDLVGNRTSATVGGIQYTYNTSPFSNQITSITHTGGERDFQYLATGQVHSDQRNSSSDYIFNFNGSGRLASAYLGQSQLATYTYNGLEQRSIKTAATTTDFLYDKAGHMIAEANHATGTMIREYIWLDDLPVAMVDYTGSSPVIYDIHADHIGRPGRLTNQNATVVWDGTFDPFGVPAGITGSVTMPLMFPGQYWDGETQLSQNWYRDYDPSIGRYIESDPIGLISGINTYSFVKANPLRKIDPTGRFSYEAWWEAEDLAGAEELVGLGPEDPFADIGAAITLGVGLGVAASLPGDTSSGTSGEIKCTPKDDCDAQAERDEQTCRMATVEGSPSRARCWASVQDRYGACRQGQPLPPLVLW